MAYQIIWEEKGILVKFSGTVGEQEVMTINNIMYSDARFDRLTYQIADYTDVTNIHITQQDAKVIGTLDRTSSHWNSNRMRNVVVTKDEKFKPIVETYFKEFKGTLWECRIFETLEMAYAWVKAD
ncbi:MAG: hypothetical protein WCO02_03175 [Bacteroidota bacterium]